MNGLKNMLNGLSVHLPKGIHNNFFDNLMSEVLETNIVNSLNGEFRGYELTLCEGKYKPYIYLSQRVWESRAHIISYYYGNREAISLSEEVSDMILEYVRKFDT